MPIRNKVQTFAENHPIAAGVSCSGIVSLVGIGLGLILTTIASKTIDYVFGASKEDTDKTETPEPITVEEEVISE